MVTSDRTQKFINPSAEQTAQNTKTEKKDQTATISPDQLNIECRKGVNVEKPECVEWFNQLDQQKNAGQTYTIKYDPNDPYKIPYDQFQYQVTDTPQFVGCVKFDGKYYAYTQQGTRLNVPQSDCEKYMSGDRPFNPMYQPTPQGMNNVQLNNQVNYPNNNQQNSEQLAKMEQAKIEGLI